MNTPKRMTDERLASEINRVRNVVRQYGSTPSLDVYLVSLLTEQEDRSEIGD